MSPSTRFLRANREAAAFNLHRTVCLRLSRRTHSVTPRIGRARRNRLGPARGRKVTSSRIHARRVVGDSAVEIAVSAEVVGVEPELALS